MDQISQMILSIPGLSSSEQRVLISAFDFEMGGELFNRQIEESYLNSMERIVNAGVFEEVDARTIADVTHKAYHAEMNSAPMAYVEELILIGFTRPVTSAQLEQAAKALDEFEGSGIDPVVYQEIISYGLANGWSSHVISGVSQGLIRGQIQGVDLEKLALSLIITVDQGFGAKPIDSVVDEGIKELQDSDRKDPFEKNQKDMAYQAMQEAINKGVTKTVAQELFYEAVESNWKPKTVEAVFQGMIESHTIGLTPEKIALAMLIRVEQGMGDTSPSQMVQEEIAYVKSIENERLEAIRNDKTIDYSKSVPRSYRDEVFIEPKRRETPPQQPKVYTQTPSTQLNTALLEQSIRTFLGVPYVWGGNSRRGTDCSGFTQTVYREQRIYIPRVSREQFRVGWLVQQLQYGDLVFFNKYGYGMISHVGIYVGGGRFAHASCSRGVTISRLDKRYYRARYVGAKRVI
jgi:hypothetical protein